NYIKKEMAKVFIHKDDGPKINDFFKNMLASGKKAERTEDEESLVDGFFNNIKESLDYVNYMLDDLNIKNTCEAVVTHVFESINHEVAKLSQRNQKNIKKYFADALGSENDFATKQITLTSIISTNILNEAEWGTREMIEKVVYAS